MKYMVIATCSGCGAKFVGEDESLYNAIGALSISAAEGDHLDFVSQEIENIERKVAQITKLREILGMPLDDK